MGDTKVTGEIARARTTTGQRKGLLTSLFPRFDEAVSPDFYRLTGKLRAFTNVLFLCANFALAPQIEALGFDRNVHWRVMLAFTCIHLLDGTLAVSLWKVAKTTRAMRRLTFASVALETFAVVGASWIYGAVNSPYIGIELLFIMIYRLAFDFRVGVTAFAIVLVGQWGIVMAEAAGVLPHQPIAAGPIDGVYAAATREVGAMVYLTFMFVLAFATASWAIGRVRHRDVALRLLRDSLYAADRGRVGRHTGLTLRDTYALGELIGSGGAGEVYQATHLRTSRRVAVKMLHPHLVDDPNVLTRFRREAEITGALGSEHIVGVIDVDESEGQPFLVLELVEGESLGARVAKDGPLAFAVLSDIVEQIARGLDLAHKAGVIHRDLKPENIFLCPKRGGGVTVKILDFGVSKIGGAATALTNDVAIIGTPDYMSPEQAEGRTELVTAAADVFALGSVCYFALTGRRPFVADSVPAVLRKICDEEPPPIEGQREGLPGGVATVLAVALAKKPADRYQTASELATDLGAALSGASDDAKGPRRSKRPTTVDETGETLQS